MDLFNNENNASLKFKLNSEGIDINSIECRSVFITNEKIDYMIKGNMDNQICVFDIPKMSLYENKGNGKIKFEIISDDRYFNVWEDEFEIKSKSTIKVENIHKENTDHLYLNAELSYDSIENSINEKTNNTKKEINPEQIKKLKYNIDDGVIRFNKFNKIS